MLHSARFIPFSDFPWQSVAPPFFNFRRRRFSMDRPAQTLTEMEDASRNQHVPATCPGRESSTVRVCKVAGNARTGLEVCN